MLEAGFFGWINKMETVLQEGERLLGVKSQLFSTSPRQNDLQFVIGKL
jgi:hypothetical protein